MGMEQTLQRHFGVLSKFAHVESRLRGRQRRGKAAFGVPINPCARRACSRSVAVGQNSLKNPASTGLSGQNDLRINGSASEEMAYVHRIRQGYRPLFRLRAAMMQEERNH